MVAVDAVASLRDERRGPRPHRNCMARDKVFISYCHADRALMGELKTMLAPVLNQGQVVLWDDTQIQPGAKWREEIQAGLDAARVGVLLVSDNFLSSGFITNQEVPQLLQAAEQDGATLFWICLSPCLWQHSPVARYQAANTPDKPLDQIPKAKRKAAWQAICLKLLQVAHAPAAAPPPEPKPAARPVAEPKAEATSAVRAEPKPPATPAPPTEKPPRTPPLLRPAQRVSAPPDEPAPRSVSTSQPESFLPPQPAPFNPIGRWRVEVMALVHSTMTVDFYPNAACQGSQVVPYLGSLPFQGGWGYDLSSRTLTIQGMVQYTPFLLVIVIQGGQGANYTGLGMDGITYQFTRLG